MLSPDFDNYVGNGPELYKQRLDIRDYMSDPIVTNVLGLIST